MATRLPIDSSLAQSASGSEILKLADLLEVSQTLSSTLNLPSALTRVVEILKEHHGLLSGSVVLLDEFEKKQIPEIWINPGAESDRLMAEAARRKLNMIYACSIVGIGSYAVVVRA